MAILTKIKSIKAIHGGISLVLTVLTVLTVLADLTPGRPGLPALESILQRSKTFGLWSLNRQKPGKVLFCGKNPQKEGSFCGWVGVIRNFGIGAGQNCIYLTFLGFPGFGVS